MFEFTANHKLVEGKDQAPSDRPRSRYSYLFRDLANLPDAGVFTGTDEDGTKERLKTFVDCFAGPYIPPPYKALSMQVPAAYTYFGQFMNHDMSAPVGGLRVDVGSIKPVGIIGSADPGGLGKTFRAQDVDTILEHFANEQGTPLSLASLYGDGPRGAAANLYEADRKRFLLGKVTPAPEETFTNMKPRPVFVLHATDVPDILRTGTTPLMADLRNDGNLILSQLHLAFLLVHNEVVRRMEALANPPSDIFAEARQLVTLHYHWLILNDYLPSLLSKSVLKRPLADWVALDPQGNNRRPDEIPMEFTTAAFRFGHSMVGHTYDFNANFGRDGHIDKAGAKLVELFDFTSEGKMRDPTGRQVQLPDHWVIDWDRMTRVQTPGWQDNDLPGGAEQIDLVFAPDMLTVAGDMPEPEQGSILFRNLLRGFHRRMPFGQALALACDVRPLDDDQITGALQALVETGLTLSNVAEDAKRLGIVQETPAWLYFLCEAKALEFGERVGPTASTIIADTIVGLMRSNPNSVLRTKSGRWHPRDSLLKDSGDKPLDSLRAFLLFAGTLSKPA
jgi:hypothetical protein